MTEAVERLVNLALFIAKAGPRGVTADACRGVEGYPGDQDEAAFLRMFERDKEQLRAAGFAIEVDEAGRRYSLDRAATYRHPVTFTREEATLLKAVGVAMLGDESFPFADDLRLALAKLMTDVPDVPAPDVGALGADESPREQGAAVAAIAAAADARKRVAFAYTNARGESRHHDVEPYGLFLRDGRWYLVARDPSLDEIRTYAVARMATVEPNTRAPKTSDFDRPPGFEVRAWIALPFQYGAPGVPRVLAAMRLSGQAVRRVATLTAEQGTFLPAGRGVLTWRIMVSDPVALASWVVASGPGIELTGPPEAVEAMRAGLANVVESHA
jgi:predicted DNA-binding transcriptional regulator YafY